MPSLCALLTVAVATMGTITVAQLPPAEQHSTNFNSTFALNQSQIISANLSSSSAQTIDIALQFERTQLAFGGSFGDDFYTLPPRPAGLKAGMLLKVQNVTDVTQFAVPPNTALSRILYTTADINGTVFPASAFILWPFQPRGFQNSTLGKGSKAPVVLWDHGTSGYFSSGAPSMMRGLWYGDAAVFSLALEGYAVVAPDYAGLGIGNSWDGTKIPHAYLCSTASGYDSLYALRAAKKAFFSRLADDFVVMGHSQGGGVAWRTAELLTSESDKFADLEDGYRGTVAGSPTTNVFGGPLPLIMPFTVQAMKNMFPSTKIEALTALGENRLRLAQETEAGLSAAEEIFLGDGQGSEISTPNATDLWYVKQYSALSNAGRRALHKPIVILQGTEDQAVFYSITEKTYNDTCNQYPHNDMEFHVLDGVGHVPVLYATHQYWLKWIEDRFEGRPVQKKGCFKTELASWLPLDNYLKAGNSIPLWSGLPEYSYETPLGP